MKVTETSSPASTLSTGSVVGNYRVEAKIGEGGMGAVYLATHPLLGRKAAIKILLPEHSKRPDLVTRFFNEAKTAASLRHPALVEVFDFGFLPDGAGYLVMDFLEGQSLAARLSRVTRLSAEAAAEIGRQIAAGVAAAHGQGIVHRDLKPDNVFLVPDPENPGRERIKILDFGIAKLLLTDSTASQGARDVRTSTGMLLGTPLFMAPEQCRGSGQIDHRADIYSLGCILYMMLSGRPPFDHQGVGEVLAAHLHEPVPPLRTGQPGVPAAMEAIAMRALAKKPEERFQNMAELAGELQRFLAGRTGAPAALSGQRPAGDTPVPAPAPGRRGLMVAAGLLAAAAGLVWWRKRPAGPPPAQPAAGAEPLASGAPPATRPPEPTAPAAPAHASASTAEPPAAEAPAGTGQRPAAAEAPSPGETTGDPAEPVAALGEPAGQPPGTGQPPKAETDPAQAAPDRKPPARQEPPPESARARALYRKAIQHRSRGEEEQALLALRAALATGGLAPDDKADAERQSINLRRKFGEVEILCDLPQALVTVDGRPLGRTPLPRPALLRPGRHVLMITRTGFRTIQRAIEVAGGGRVTLRFSVER